MKQATPDKIAKLPQWAQDHISDLTYKLESAIRTLNEAINGREASNMYYESHPITGENAGPTWKRFYIPENTVHFVFGESRGFRDEEVAVRMSEYANERTVSITFDSRNFCIIPASGNAIEIVHRKVEGRR